MGSGTRHHTMHVMRKLSSHGELTRFDNVLPHERAKK